MVKPGDPVRVEDSLITIESDKATMEVPSPEAGIVKNQVKVGDKVSEGSPIVVIETAASGRRQTCGSGAACAPPPSLRRRPASRVKPDRADAQPASSESPCRRRRSAGRLARALRLRRTRPMRCNPAPESAARPEAQSEQSRTRARRCANSRASSASISRRPGHRTKRPNLQKRRAEVRQNLRSRQTAATGRASAPRSISRHGRRSTSRKFGAIETSRYRASAGFRKRTWRATG